MDSVTSLDTPAAWAQWSLILVVELCKLFTYFTSWCGTLLVDMSVPSGSTLSPSLHVQSGNTPLLRAAVNGHAEVALFLLRNGSSVMEQSNVGWPKRILLQPNEKCVLAVLSNYPDLLWGVSQLHVLLLVCTNSVHKCWRKLCRWIAMHRVNSSHLYIEQFCRMHNLHLGQRWTCSCGCVGVGRRVYNCVCTCVGEKLECQGCWIACSPQYTHVWNWPTNIHDPWCFYTSIHFMKRHFTCSQV